VDDRITDPTPGTTRITGSFELTIDYVVEDEDLSLIRGQIKDGIRDRILTQWGGDPRLDKLELAGEVRYFVQAQS
jgi:hypothetical protein